MAKVCDLVHTGTSFFVNDVLVVVGDTLTFNPTFDRREIERKLASPGPVDDHGLLPSVNAAYRSVGKI
jgi:hypothetical protein